MWEEVEQHTNENVELSAVFLLFMVLAALIAAVGIYLDSAILIVGAMVVGPEFGPIAGFCVALVQRRRDLAIRSGVALAVGVPAGHRGRPIWRRLIFKATGLTPTSSTPPTTTSPTSSPARTRSPSSSPSAPARPGCSRSPPPSPGALIGVLISVTTIPAAANVGVAAAYQDRDGWTGSLAQLALNLASILVAGTAVLAIQRMLYDRRGAATRRLQREPSDDQTSTLVRTFSTTASVNSVVVE